MSNRQDNIWGIETAPSLVMFDLDGTLVDSLDDLTASVNFTRKAFNLPPLSKEEVRQCIGKGVHNLVSRTLPGHDDELNQGVALFLEHNSANIAVHSRLYPGVRPLLTALSAANIPLMVVSNKQTDLCNQLLSKLGIADCFNDILGGDAVVQCKPSPVPLLAAIDRAGANSATTVMIGDSSNDFDAARAAGVRSIACTFGFGEPWEMERADTCIDSLEQLLPLPF